MTVLSCLPGVGQTVLATLLAEAPQALARRDYKALRCLCGVAPVTRRSGMTPSAGPNTLPFVLAATAMPVPSVRSQTACSRSLARCSDPRPATSQPARQRVMPPDLLSRRGVTAPLQKALTNGGESPRPRAWFGRGAGRVFTRWPRPLGVAPGPTIPSGKAIERRWERGGSTDRTGLGVSTLTGQVGSPIVHQSALALEQVRAPVRRLDGGGAGAAISHQRTGKGVRGASRPPTNSAGARASGGSKGGRSAPSPGSNV